jgi:two-component system, sensor histidine kinase and response regulator
MPDTDQTILVVDDVATNVDVLIEALADEYTVRVATDGESALRAARRNPPDLVLLDVMMPQMDGFEVCRRLKADPVTAGARVIFLTALADETDEAEGLALGAVDYITKPFNPALVKARVANQLALKRYRDHLEQLVEERTRELAEAHERLKALDAAKRDYLDAIAHELRTPATGVLGIAELALSEIEDCEMREEYLEIFRWSRGRLLEAIDNALQLAALQSGNADIDMTPLDLGTVVARIVEGLRDEFAARGLVLNLVPASPGLVLGNVELVQQSVTILLKVALHMAARDADVAITYAEESDEVRMRIMFESEWVEEGLRNTFFDTFSYDRASSVVEQLGLAVPLAENILRAMGGGARMGEADPGAFIEIVFPKAFPETNAAREVL